MALPLMGLDWRQCNRFPRYDVSRCGQVKREDRLLTLSAKSIGYLYVTLRHDGATHRPYVHRLVCEAFHGAPPEGHEVNHINGVKGDNRAENLEWVTHAQNMARDRMTGRPGRPTNSGRVLSAADVRDIHWRFHAEGEGQASLAADFEVSQSLVSHIITRRLWPDIYDQWHAEYGHMARRLHRPANFPIGHQHLGSGRLRRISTGGALNDCGQKQQLVDKVTPASPCRVR